MPPQAAKGGMGRRYRREDKRGDKTARTTAPRDRRVGRLGWRPLHFGEGRAGPQQNEGATCSRNNSGSIILAVCTTDPSANRRVRQGHQVAPAFDGSHGPGFLAALVAKSNSQEQEESATLYEMTQQSGPDLSYCLGIAERPVARIGDRETNRAPAQH